MASTANHASAAKTPKIQKTPKARVAPTAGAARRPAVKSKAPASSSAKAGVEPKGKDKDLTKPIALPFELKADEKLAIVKIAAPSAPKQKLVRDSFTMPQVDFDLVDVLKARALVFQRPAKKSELLRAGLHALAAMNDAQLRKSLEALTPLKAGRPKKADATPTAPKSRN